MRLVSLLTITAALAACAMTDPHMAANAQSTAPDAAPAPRRIWADGWFGGSISPHGDMLAFRVEQNDIVVRNVPTGTEKRLARVPGDGRVVLSHRGDKLLFDHMLADGQEIVVMNTDGSGQHVLRTLHGEQWSELWGWSPDDKTITAVVTTEPTGWEIEAIDVATGAVHSLRKTADQWFENPQFSHDGRYVAYTQSVTSDNYDVHVMNRDGSGDHVVVGTPSYDRLMGWSASDGSLYYASRESDGAVIMEVPVRDGAAAGAPVRLKSGLSPNIDPVGTTSHGLAYAANNFTNQIMLARIDVAGARLVEPVRTLASYRNTYIPPGAVFSPDGANIAWATTSFMPTGNIVHVRSIASGEEREFKAPASHVYQVAWNTDGTGVDILVEPNTARTWQRLTLATGAIAPAPMPRVPARTDGPAVNITQPNGKLLVVRTSDNKVLYSNRPEIGLRTPPGRATLIANNEATHEVISLPLVDGARPEHVLLKYPADRRFVIIGFAPDTSIVYALRSVDASSEDEVWVVSDGSAPRKLFSAPRIQVPSLSPDGRYLTYGDRSPDRGEVWLLEK